MKKILTVTATVGVLMLAGCATNEPAPTPTPQPEPAPIQLVDTSVKNVRITYADEQVATAIKAMNARITKKDAFPKLVFQLVNLTQTKLPIEYKIQWLDQDGAPLQSSAAWLQATLTGMEVKPIVSLGKSVDAQSAQVTVRFPQNVEIYVPTPDPVEQMQIERQVIDDYNARLSAGELKM